MKILVCTDGSKESLKAIEQACNIADGCKVNEVSIIHVSDGKVELPAGTFSYGDHLRKENMDEFLRINEEINNKSKQHLLEAEQIFQSRNIHVNTILKKGSPGDVIPEVAEEGGFDLIVIGRRGISGTDKLFLGSVSNAVLQQAKTSVLVVK